MITFGGPINPPGGNDAATSQDDATRHEPVENGLASQWVRICDRLKTDVGEIEYRNWLRQMALAGQDGDEVTIHLPTRFRRDWVRSHYGDKLTALWQAENQAVHRVDLRVGSPSASPPPLGGKPVRGAARTTHERPIR